MRIQEVCNHFNVTRKAVEYYIEQALLRPSVLENGYLNFSQENVKQIRKIGNPPPSECSNSYTDCNKRVDTMSI